VPGVKFTVLFLMDGIACHLFLFADHFARAAIICFPVKFHETQASFSSVLVKITIK